MKKLDAIVAFDTTGSMGSYIAAVKKNAEYFGNEITKLFDARVAFVGIGDHCDGAAWYQPHDFTANTKQMNRDIQSIRNTGGGDGPEAYECLFRELKDWKYENPTVMVFIGDSVPHDPTRRANGDDFCPYGVDYRKELKDLKKQLADFYIVNCGGDGYAKRLHNKMTGDPKKVIDLYDFKKITNLILGLTADSGGELETFLDDVEEREGEEERATIVTLMGKEDPKFS